MTTYWSESAESDLTHLGDGARLPEGGRGGGAGRERERECVGGSRERELRERETGEREKERDLGDGARLA